MTLRTVEPFAGAATPEDLFRGQWQGRPSKLDAFKPYLDGRWNQGCTNAWAGMGGDRAARLSGQLPARSRLLPGEEGLSQPDHSQGERLPQWLDAVRRDDLPSLHTLTAGIERDRDAVIAGLTLPWYSGVVEGHANRIKMLKRQILGRAGFALLRKRVLLAN
ncbi:transposase [Streptomyces anulatus]|uniref:transposase n=1 Tax=Streptomyces anulatus TaxID=1892 RepID=UPI002E160227